VNTWAPTLKVNDEPTESLRVPSGPEPPTDPEDYRDRLMWRLKELIEHNPKQARRDLEQVATVESPDLLSTWAECPIREWAVQITSSAQMEMLLSRIDWERKAPVKKLPEEELPCLMDYLQRL
jgi:hypothetical protein